MPGMVFKVSLAEPALSLVLTKVNIKLWDLITYICPPLNGLTMGAKTVTVVPLTIFQ